MTKLPFLFVQVNFHTSKSFCDWRTLKHRHESQDVSILCTFRKLFIDFAIDTFVGQDSLSVLWALYYGLRFAPCHWAFVPYSVLCYSSFIISYVNTIHRILLHVILKLISFGLGLAVTICGTKGALPHPERRLAPAMLM